mgnify:FL=1
MTHTDTLIAPTSARHPGMSDTLIAPRHQAPMSYSDALVVVSYGTAAALDLADLWLYSLSEDV